MVTIQDFNFKAFIPSLNITLDRITLYPDGNIGIDADYFTSMLTESTKKLKWHGDEEVYEYNEKEEAYSPVALSVLIGDDWLWIQPSDYILKYDKQPISIQPKINSEELAHKSFDIVNSYHPHLVETEIRDMIHELHQLWLNSSRESEPSDLLKLFRETVMRSQIVFPETDEDVKWHEEGLVKNTDLMSKIMDVLKLGLTD